MGLVLKGRIGKKGALYLSKRVMRELGVREGTKVLLIVRRGELVVKPVFDPFELALKAPKFASTTVEEFERESEEMQRELLED